MSELRSGYLIVYVMVLTFITMALGLSVLSVAGAQYRYVVDNTYRQNAAHGARACASAVAEKLTENSSFSGFNNQAVFSNLNNSQGRVACTATITDSSGDAKNVDITSTMHRFDADPRPISYKMRAVLRSDGGSSGGSGHLNGGILAGHAGLYVPLWGSIRADQINVIGKLYGSYGGIASLGTAADPLGKITVANVACGTSGNWPQPCSTQPVEAWYGSNLPDIYADTCAPGQTAYLSKFKGVGLSTDCPVASGTTPGFDKAGFVDKMTNTISASNLLNTGPGGCLDKVPIIPSAPYLGSYYYGTEVQIPANTRINGDLSRYYDGATEITGSSSLQHACTLVLQGDVYVDGNVLPKVIYKISDSAMDDITAVINGRVEISSSHPSILPNSHGKIMHVISFHSSNPACSSSHVLPSAAEKTCLTPAQAMASAQVESFGAPLDPAITFSNTGTVHDMSGATFYAYYGTVDMGCTRLTVAAIGGQGISGSCLGINILSNITVTGSNPTFGDLIPSTPPTYRIVDMTRL